MSGRIAAKIKAMLAKAAEGSGATEGEADSALAMATALMMKYGISQKDVADADKETVQRGDWSNQAFLKWHHYTAEAAGFLYTCKVIVLPGKKKAVQFVGLPSNIEATEITFDWINAQVERLYKESLPKGLDRETRAELRKTFKMACAIRVRSRAWEIVKSMANNDAVALEYTGSTALVVKSHQEQQLGDIQNFFDKLFDTGDLRKGRILRVDKAGIGTSLGLKAGDQVRLNQGIHQSRLKIGSN